MRFNREFIKTVLPEALFFGADFPQEVSFTVDSRALAQGDVFIALKGAKADGHDFVVEAVKNGAAGLIINNSQQECLQKLGKEVKDKLAIAVVPDTYAALLALASGWRKQFNYPVVGITGSVGKTSTKELLVHIMKLAGKKCLSSVGNKNWVVPLALAALKMRPDHDVAVFEMGISRRGEMARMAELIRPTTAIITTIGHSHMEGLGSISDIASEKRDIFKYFKEDSIGIINGDQPLLATIAYTHPIIKFGCKMTNQLQARKIQAHGAQTHLVFKLYRERFKITMPTNHSGPVMNGLAAAAAAHVIGISSDIIVKGLQTYAPMEGRFLKRTIKAQKGVLIDDCYNASPESMKAALLAFEKLEEKGQKIAVLGDMLELGVNAPFWHRQLGRFLRKVPSVHHVVFVGDNVKWAQKTMPAYVTCDIVPNWQAAVECLEKRLDKEAVVLVKGSRSIGLDNLVREVAE